MCDPGINIKYINTKEQLADIMTKVDARADALELKVSEFSDMVKTIHSLVKRA